GLDDGPHVAEIRALAGEGGSVALAGFVVVRQPWQSWAYPWIYGTFAVMVVLTLASLVWNWRYRPALLPSPTGGGANGHVPRRPTAADLRARSRARRSAVRRRCAHPPDGAALIPSALPTLGEGGGVRKSTASRGFWNPSSWHAEGYNRVCVGDRSASALQQDMTHEVPMSMQSL